jgi:hypothetical protein
LIRGDNYVYLALYIAGSVILGVAAVFLGAAFIKSL